MQRLVDFFDLDEPPRVRIHSLLQPKDNGKCDEASSLHMMINVMIYWFGGNKKIPAEGESPAGIVDC
jgi:hypothetical protein